MSGGTGEDRDRGEAVAKAAWRFLLNRHRLAQTTPSADPVELHRAARQLATGDTHRPIEARIPKGAHDHY
ncbi:MAG: hypothetical protein R2761_28780 [Acidimicrobiales bacterium]